MRDFEQVVKELSKKLFGEPIEPTIDEYASLLELTDRTLTRMKIFTFGVLVGKGVSTQDANEMIAMVQEIQDV